MFEQEDYRNGEDDGDHERVAASIVAFGDATPDPRACRTTACQSLVAHLRRWGFNRHEPGGPTILNLTEPQRIGPVVPLPP
jgi:hypothetical protein